jgi:hypothetical protein
MLRIASLSEVARHFQRIEAALRQGITLRLKAL